MKNLPNTLTILRIIGSIFIIFTVPFSLFFWLLYTLCGLSDILDGLLARVMKCESEFGAKLDSIGDAIFLMAVVIVLFPVLNIPRWIWPCIVLVASIRILSYFIGAKKFHTFSALHTYANKLTGLLLFIFPILFVVFGIKITIIILGFSAIFSAIEEFLIILKSTELNRDCKSIFKL